VLRQYSLTGRGAIDPKRSSTPSTAIDTSSSGP
jgi:hypothetical protein